ncbi:hypothetical protein MUK42_30605 [Musa troglodytarum]|uniref:Uncharacterized protein n=1 Tax=Musa troglodytarum TaxID=320322 RepID=A0A9E7JU56_9LILI|nr:hypothetical protein MUK42_30605 [Musa troglodytarum]
MQELYSLLGHSTREKVVMRDPGERLSSQQCHGHSRDGVLRTEVKKLFWCKSLAFNSLVFNQSHLKST